MNQETSIQRMIRDLANGGQTYSYPALRRRSIARRRAKGKKLLKGYTWDASDNQFNLNKIMNENTNEKIFLGVSDFEDLLTTETLQRRSTANKSTIQRETTVLANRKDWAQWAETNFSSMTYIQTSSSNGFILEEDTDNFIKFDVNSNSTTVRAFGDEVFSDSIILLVENKFSIVTSYIEWIYGADGNSVNVPLNRDRLPVEEMYPFLKGESLGDYYDRYMNSSANILLLIGPPGTGKTTFIRGLLAHRNCSAIVTYDAAILEKDAFFAKFIEDDAEVMVLEDSDAFLKSRSDGNTMMHRFLNVGDGLVTTKGKKMIFSTNLPSIRDIDSALVRPGRCFDILTFSPLHEAEATKLAKRLGASIDSGNKEYSIADIFNKQQNKAEQRKVGFI